MTKDKLVGLLQMAYRFGRDNGSGRSDKNFNNFLEKSKIREELSKLHQPTVISAVCDKCLGRGSHVIYDTCIECKKCNGNGTQTDL